MATLSLLRSKQASLGQGRGLAAPSYGGLHRQAASPSAHLHQTTQVGSSAAHIQKDQPQFGILASQ